MNSLEAFGYVLNLGGLVVGIGALIYRAKTVAWVAAVPVVIGAAIVFNAQ